MAAKDTYQSIEAPCEGLFRDNGSRFIAKAYPVESEEEIKQIVAAIKKEYHDARHHCYAWRLGLDGAGRRSAHGFRSHVLRDPRASVSTSQTRKAAASPVF